MKAFIVAIVACLLWFCPLRAEAQTDWSTWINVEPWLNEPKNEPKNVEQIVALANRVSAETVAGHDDIGAQAVRFLAAAHANRYIRARRDLTPIIAVSPTDWAKDAQKGDHRYQIGMSMVGFEQWTLGIGQSIKADPATSRDPIAGEAQQLPDKYAQCMTIQLIRLVVNDGTATTISETQTLSNAIGQIDNHSTLHPGRLSSYTQWNAGPDNGVDAMIMMGIQSAFDLGLLNDLWARSRVNATTTDREALSPDSLLRLYDRLADVLTHAVLVSSGLSTPANSASKKYVEQVAVNESEHAPSQLRVSYRFDPKTGDKQAKWRWDGAAAQDSMLKYAGYSDSVYEDASGVYTLVVSAQLLNRLLVFCDAHGMHEVGSQYKWKLVKDGASSDGRWQISGGTLRVAAGRYCNLSTTDDAAGHIDRLIDAGLRYVLSQLFDKSSELRSDDSLTMFAVAKLFAATGFQDLVVEGGAAVAWHKKMCEKLASTQTGYFPASFAILTMTRGYRPLYASQSPSN